MRPELLTALADRSFVFDGSPAWTAEHALAVLTVKGAVEHVGGTLRMIEASTAPVPRDWLGDRLTTMWMMFMSTRRETDPATLAIWLGEYLRLLQDLPWDIVASAIDGAIQTAKHGYLPSVGEIRTKAAPLLADRQQTLQRLRDICAVVPA